MIKLKEPTSRGGALMQLSFFEKKLEKAHLDGNETEVLEIEEKIKMLKDAIKVKFQKKKSFKKPDENAKKRMEYLTE